MSITVLTLDTEGTGSDTSLIPIIGSILVIVLLVSVIGYALWRRSTNQLANRLLAERQAEEEAAVSPPPTVEEQAAMFASRSSGDDFASLAGIDYSSSVSKNTNDRESSVLEDLFSDDVAEPTPVVETKDIDNRPTNTSSIDIPEVSSPKPVSSGLGIEIPDFDTDSDSLMVQAACTSCDTRFEVELPSDRTSGRTACPSCGEIQTVSR